MCSLKFRFPFSEGDTTYSYEKAHWLASKKYPWEFSIKGGMTDDQIRNIIETELKKYI